MNSSEIQIYRKQRLKDAIAKFFGSNVALAKRLKNKDGEPLKDGSYIGQMLKPEGQPGSRPIDEDRVREIEAIRPELRGWFDIPQKGADREKFDVFARSANTVLSYSDTTSALAPVVEWARLGADLYKENDSFDGEKLSIPESASNICKWVRVDGDHPRLRIMKGDLVALEPVNRGEPLLSGKVYLFKAVDETLFLAEYRPLTGGNFEAIPDTGPPMDRDRHGIEIVARKRGTWE